MTEQVSAGLDANRCQWCNGPFTPLGRGSRQRFCTPAHRQAFHSAGRRWAESAVLSGRLTIAELRDGPTEACTPHQDALTPDQAPTTGSPRKRVTDDLRRIAVDARVAVPISAEAVYELVELGWLPPTSIRDPRAIADGIARACDAIITAELGPKVFIAYTRSKRSDLA